MKTSVNILSQYDYCDGECIMNFYCIDVNDKQITVAVQRLGHVFLDTYQLFDDIYRGLQCDLYWCFSRTFICWYSRKND